MRKRPTNLVELFLDGSKLGDVEVGDVESHGVTV